MRGTTCDYCGATTTNGLALCQTCRAGLLVYLEFIPAYFRNLSRWRPSSLADTRRSTKSKGLVREMITVLETGRPLPGPSGLNVAASSDRIPRLLAEAHADVTGWLRALADDRPQMAPVIARILTMDEEPTVRLACALLTKYVDTLTTLPWVRDLVHGLGETESRLRKETEDARMGWYAGACRRCTTPTYVMPGLTWVTCQGCGATTHAGDHLEVILTEAREWLARPLRLAEAIVALVDTEQSAPRLYQRIRQWERRDKITGVRRTTREHVYDTKADQIVVATVDIGPARYRFGDVLDILLSEGPTRLTDTPSATSATPAC